MRLDIYLTTKFKLQSRNKAHELIKSKKIKIDGKIITKPSFNVQEHNVCEILEDEFYVSRSAYKLKHFLDNFKDINLHNKNALDIGSSTGGFTQILLEHQAKHISCVDVGSNQLHQSIKENKNISIYENTDIREFDTTTKYDVVTCDVSFISIHNILSSIDTLAKSEIIILFKPQFEVGREVKRDRAGVVQDKEAIINATNYFLDETAKLNWKLKHRQESKVKGKNGNSEELFYFVKSVSQANITSIAIGGFDGMHLAHQKLFSNLTSCGAIVVVETPYANLTKKHYREEYTPFPIYYYNLEDIKHYDALGFIDLLKTSYPKLGKIVVGYDFHFGANRAYSTKDLKELFDGEIIIVDEVAYDNIPVHSKYIRELLSSGDIPQANKLLNKPYKITGQMIKGQGLGTKQFVPTINIYCDDFLLPQDGIYATKTIVNNIEFNSVSFLGHRVTTDGQYAIETHIVEDDFSFKTQDIDETIQIKFIEKIRDNKKFDNFDELKQQILKDIDTVLSTLIC